MAKIEVAKKDPETFEVTVRASTTTMHTVKLSADYYLKLTGGRVSPEALIEKSFEFLLERESNTMILSRWPCRHFVPSTPEDLPPPLQRPSGDCCLRRITHGSASSYAFRRSCDDAAGFP